MKPITPIIAVGLLASLASTRAADLSSDIKTSIDQGIAWLKSSQNENGSWGDDQYPALTALPLAAIMRDPTRDPATGLSPEMKQAYEYLLSMQQEDGSIFDPAKGLATYNTSLSIMALIHAVDQPGIEDAIRRARQFLIGQQADLGALGKMDHEFDGGIGYGGSYTHSDLSNTHLALEALYHSSKVLSDRPGGVGKQLNWDAAMAFVSRCQNLEETNDLPYKVTDENRGGFVYFPGDSKAGEEEGTADTEVALRSYGSMSYAGLLSFIYADLDPEDPRVAAVKKWLGANYTVEENPFMGAQGLYYYYHTMAKTLSLAGIDELKLEDGTTADWKAELGAKLNGSQQENGSWINEGSKRWWEDDPVLVTGYTLLALEHLLGSLES